MQFSVVTVETIIADFAGPQDDTVYPNLGTVETNDAKWATFYAAAGAAQQFLPAPISD
ncbi:hypothetical protein [Paraburkholderia bannensis]|uniref:hypothetical protein n=1 Tax=Paraburkholderia bannensis TaxID=765414 RepID=UPI002AC36B60|nr:hypothetical protein [Paraburkholderia bannensis]